jgi:uncharacterized protein (DUF4415 family)
MQKSKRAIATDLKRLDEHVIRPEEYEDAPELTDEQIAAADLYHGAKLIRRGRPPSDHPKWALKLRIDADVVAHYRATGPGWQTLINAVLRHAAKLKPLSKRPALSGASASRKSRSGPRRKPSIASRGEQGRKTGPTARI